MTEKINVITDSTEWEFNIKDCEIITPVNPRTGQSYRFPAMNGEFPLEGIPGQESEGAKTARRVVVRHIPTGIEVAEDQFLPYRNREIALHKIKKKVNEWISSQQKAESELNEPSED